MPAAVTTRQRAVLKEDTCFISRFDTTPAAEHSNLSIKISERFWKVMRSTICQYRSCSTRPTWKSSLQRAMRSSLMRDVWCGYQDQRHILFGSLPHANRLSAVFVCLHEVGILPRIVLDGFPREQFVISRWNKLELKSSGGVRDHFFKEIHSVSISDLGSEQDQDMRHRLLLLINNRAVQRCSVRADHNFERFRRLSRQMQATV